MLHGHRRKSRDLQKAWQGGSKGGGDVVMYFKHKNLDGRPLCGISRILATICCRLRGIRVGGHAKIMGKMTRESAAHLLGCLSAMHLYP